MRKLIMPALLGAGLVLGVAGVALAQSAADTITARQATMKAIGGATGAIKKAIDDGANLTTVAARAQEIVDQAKRAPGQYPAGTGADSGAKTRALAAIWQNKSDFDANAGILGRLADTLGAALKANDKAAATTAFAAMTSQCGACHRPYRAPQ